MEVDINDLFGDGADLPLPSRPPPKELFQRVDELRGSGCTQYEALSSLQVIVAGLICEKRNRMVKMGIYRLDLPKRYGTGVSKPPMPSRRWLLGPE
jgi:hypothetical protein